MGINYGLDQSCRLQYDEKRWNTVKNRFLTGTSVRFFMPDSVDFQFFHFLSLFPHFNRSGSHWLNPAAPLTPYKRILFHWNTFSVHYDFTLRLRQDLTPRNSTVRSVVSDKMSRSSASDFNNVFKTQFEGAQISYGEYFSKKIFRK